MSKFVCEQCVFSTESVQRFNNHVKSQKHFKLIDSAIQFKFECNICNKKYKARCGLWNHKKNCIPQQNQLIATDTANKKMDEITQELKEFKNAFIELSAKPLNQIITTNHNNNNNNTIETQNNQFNISLFLNENVKPTISFMDILTNLKIDKSYKQAMQRDGYLDNLVNMVKDVLKEIPIKQRPIHCIKNEIAEQEVIHIHDNNEWKREVELDWSSQIYNYYRGDLDLEEHQKKRIFHSMVKMEETILEQVKELFTGNIQAKIFEKENICEMEHVPNKINFVKAIIEYIKLDNAEFSQIMGVLQEKKIMTNV